MANEKESSELTDEEIEALLLADDEEDQGEEDLKRPDRRWLKRVIGLVIPLALLSNIIAFLPQIYHLESIQFIKKNRELSQNEMVQQYKEAVVIVHTNNRKGTGFNITKHGIIVTNDHVIGTENTALVKFKEGRTLLADVVARDEELDIAILKVREGEELELPTLPLNKDKHWREGDPIIVIGNPLLFSHMANEGTIRGITTLSDRSSPVMMLEAPIYQGNSGSPVIDADGKVIGVVFATLKIAHAGETVKVGLAIPSEEILYLIEAYE